MTRQIIEAVEVTAGNVHDQDSLTDLLAPHRDDPAKPIVFGDCAYGSGQTRHTMHEAGFDLRARLPTVPRRHGRFSKDDFIVDLAAATVGCPAGHTVPIVGTTQRDRSGRASFGGLCADCPLRARCTTSTSGRSISLHEYEQLLQDAKATQADPDWQADYRATRPKVERKIGHLMFRQHGGRQARTRGAARVLTDLVTRAAAVNANRLAVLGVHHTDIGWQRAGP